MLKKQIRLPLSHRLGYWPEIVIATAALCWIVANLLGQIGQAS